MKANRQLVILTTHFGTNFSGGSTATCEIFVRLESNFEKVTVIGTQLGLHPFRNLEFIRYKNWLHAIRIIRKFPLSSIFYGDFYNAFLYAFAKVPFYFTYHDNWPEMARFGLKNRMKSLFYIPAYQHIFRSAKTVFVVSENREKLISQFTSNHMVVKNGFTRSDVESKNANSGSILMVGSIDQRKYQLAIDLFNRWGNKEITIDIYGHTKDESLAKKLSRFPFVRLRGFHHSIPYQNYKLLLHTSQMENLPLVFCEAIHHGVPVLAFDVGASNEIVTQSNGVLIPPYDVARMSTFLNQNVSENEPPLPMDKSVLKLHSWEDAASSYAHKMLKQ